MPHSKAHINTELNLYRLDHVNTFTSSYQNRLKMYCLLDKKGFIDSQMHTTVPVKCHSKINVKLKMSRLVHIGKYGKRLVVSRKSDVVATSL